MCVAHTFAHDTQKVRKITTNFSNMQIFCEKNLFCLQNWTFFGNRLMFALHKSVIECKTYEIPMNYL